MPQETVGYVKLEWTCKRCGSKNVGTTKICAACGNVMSDTDKFDLPAQQELIKDEKEIAAAQVGPDITCKYCGARNRGDATICSQCSAELKEGTARQAGQTLGAFDTTARPDVKCPYCGELNPATALKCQKCAGSLARRPVDQPKPVAQPVAKPANTGLLAVIGLAVLAVCVFLFIQMTRTSDTGATVQAVQWQRSIAIMGLAPVTRETWEDQIPSGAQKGSCIDKVRRTQSNPAPNADKVCGTPYTVDQGNGTAKVVQDCEYQVKDQWCKYTREELGVVDTAIARGTDDNPLWPKLNLLAGQQAGDRTEKYDISFSSDGKKYPYTTDDAAEFARYTIGSRWTLKINGLGGVVSVEAAR
jgi:DNA-directed RNA polymerase subunit RPC12/RpoP